ncbi:CD99 molecule isoform 1 precursor [Danio rerio]|uniref:CD99 molecule isoform 1 precursor n=1 Tax=Danio rerio TaxID=7955 RepID=A0JMK7_DANRE|nr:CD99 molecule precursor [Danio rerio]AAI25915.1 Zgc:153928 [Danio rerio]|eukprot:NP_001073449.1 CD99 molecule precursor [Danio rerio]
MNSYTWILLLLAGLAATKAQELDLSDAFGDDDDEIPTEKPKEKPPPPKNADPGFDLSDAFESDPKKPAVVPPKSVDDKKKPASGGELDLSDAFGPDTETKKPMVPPKERETGGRSFDDNDLIDVSERGGYKPDGGGSRGRGGAPSSDDQSGGAEQPQGGALAAIISSVGVAVLGAASSYFAYQKKKLCFKVQGGEDPESGKSHGTNSEPQVLSNLLRSS